MGLRKAASRAEPLLVDLSELVTPPAEFVSKLKHEPKWFETGQPGRPNTS